MNKKKDQLIKWPFILIPIHSLEQDRTTNILILCNKFKFILIILITTSIIYLLFKYYFSFTKHLFIDYIKYIQYKYITKPLKMSDWHE